MTRQNFDRDAALRDALSGLKIRDIANKYKISWADARKIRQEAYGAPVADTAEESLVWEMKIEIPEHSLDQLIHTLDPEECLAALLSLEPPDKFTALQFIVQRRMLALLGGTETREKVQRVAQRVHEFANGSSRADDTVRTESTFRVDLTQPASEEAPVNHA